MLILLSLPHLVDNSVKNIYELGRNLMCERTLPSLPVLKQALFLNGQTAIARLDCSNQCFLK